MGNPARIAARGVLRDWRGCWVVGFSQNIGVSSVLLAESRGIYSSIKLGLVSYDLGIYGLTQVHLVQLILLTLQCSSCKLVLCHCFGMQGIVRQVFSDEDGSLFERSELSGGWIDHDVSEDGKQE